MTLPKRNLGESEQWGRVTEKEIEDLKNRIRSLEGGRKITAKAQSILADLVSRGEVKDQLLQDRIDFQGTVTYASTPPTEDIPDPGDPDAGGEVFPPPDPSEGENPSGDQGDTDPFPPFVPDETIPEPDQQWVYVDPDTGRVEGEWHLIDEIWEPRQIGSGTIASEAVIREKISQDILDELDQASQDANQAIIAANGKNTIYRGPNEPTPPQGGFVAGDTWFDTSSGDTTIKTWTGAAWAVQEVGTESLAVGAITAESGIIASLDAGVISVGTLNSDRIGAKTITGEKLLVGRPRDLAPGPGGYEKLYETGDGEPASYRSTTSDPTGQYLAIPVSAPTINQRSIYGPMTPVREGEKITWESYTTFTNPNPNTNWSTFLYWYDVNGDALPSPNHRTAITTEGQSGGITGWSRATVEVPADAEWARVRFYTVQDPSSSGERGFRSFNIRVQTSGTIIEDGAITTGKIEAGAITSDLIGANVVEARHIATHTITADKLLVADMRNFTPGPGGYEDAYSLTRATFVNNSNDPTGRAIRFNGGTTSDGQARGPMLPVRKGEEFYLEARYSWYGSSDTGGTTQLRMEWFADPNEPRIGQSTAVTRASGTSGAYISGTVTAPEGAQYARWHAYTSNQSGPGDAALYDLTCLPRTGGSLIVDGAITADKLAANAVTADKIQANAIDGKTITGATIRTAASGARTQITGSGLQVFNSSNQELVRVGHGISTGMSVRNPSSGSLTPLAPMVFGSVYMHLTGNVTFSAGGNGTWSPWYFSGPGPSISSPTGRVLAILVTRIAETGSGQGEIESYVGLSTTQAPGGHGVTVADLGGSFVTGSANKAKAIIASTVGNFPAATMVVLSGTANTTYYPRIRTRALKYTSTNVIMNNQTLYMIPV